MFRITVQKSEGIVTDCFCSIYFQSGFEYRCLFCDLRRERYTLPLHMNPNGIATNESYTSPNTIYQNDVYYICGRCPETQLVAYMCDQGNGYKFKCFIIKTYCDNYIYVVYFYVYNYLYVHRCMWTTQMSCHVLARYQYVELLHCVKYRFTII